MSFKKVKSVESRDTGPVSDKLMDRFSTDMDAFAIRLYMETLKNGYQNIFLSPYSIATVLSMLYAGADGTTKSQMRNVLGFSLADDYIHKAFNTLDLQLVKSSRQSLLMGQSFILNTANGIWCQKDYRFKKNFLDLLSSYYDSGVYLVDFHGHPDESRQTINAWVEDKTDHRIKELLKSGDITPITRMIVTNAVYFKAQWEKEFDKEQTKKADFFTLDGNVVRIDMMDMSGYEYFRYVKKEEYEAVVLPYVGGVMGMLVIMPSPGKFKEYQADFTANNFKGLLSQLKMRRGKVSLPKFEIPDFRVTLVDILGNMGMKSAFSQESADFSKMTDQEKIYISGLIHQTFLHVDEVGTEAAAASSTAMAGAHAFMGEQPPPPFNMRVDRPFIFAIMDMRTHVIFFIGRVLNPAE